MDIKKEAVRACLEDGISYQALSKKYGVSRSTINKWVLVQQGIYDLPGVINRFLTIFSKKRWVRNLNRPLLQIRAIWKKRFKYWRSNWNGKSFAAWHSIL